MKITRTAALLLACCLLSACGPSATASQDTTAPTAGNSTIAAPTTTAEPETTALSSATQLGEYDFGGATYTILGRDYAKLGTLPDIEFNVETQNGDIINDTIYKRNRTVEEQYKVVIEAVKPDGNVVTVVENSQMANDGAYDLVWAHINSMTSLSTKGLLADYNSLPVIDITQPWWNQLATESLTVNGRCYLQMNYIPFTGVLLSHCLYYNKDMATDNGIEDIYALVKNNEWTFEKFAEMSKKVSRGKGEGQYSLEEYLSKDILAVILMMLGIIMIFALIQAVIVFIIGGAARLGYARFNLNLVDGKEAVFQDLFSQFHRLGDGFIMNLLVGLYTFLWTLLFIIPGIVKSYSYAMTPYILYEHPDYSANDAITESRRIMDGNKFRLFCLEFSFFGWSLLCALPTIIAASALLTGIGGMVFLPLILLTVVGELFLRPYMEAAHAAFYRDVSYSSSIEEMWAS